MGRNQGQENWTQLLHLVEPRTGNFWTRWYKWASLTCGNVYCSYRVNGWIPSGCFILDSREENCSYRNEKSNTRKITKTWQWGWFYFLSLKLKSYWLQESHREVSNAEARIQCRFKAMEKEYTLNFSGVGQSRNSPSRSIEKSLHNGWMRVIFVNNYSNRNFQFRNMLSL